LNVGISRKDLDGQRDIQNIFASENIGSYFFENILDDACLRC
jgi:hypothetical protein